MGLLVFPIRVFGMLQVPDRAAAAYFRKSFEIVLGRRRSGQPFQCPRVPRVIAGGRIAFLME